MYELNFRILYSRCSKKTETLTLVEWVMMHYLRVRKLKEPDVLNLPGRKLLIRLTAPDDALDRLSELQ